MKMATEFHISVVAMLALLASIHGDEKMQQKDVKQQQDGQYGQHVPLQVQFVDGQPVQPAHSVFDDIQSTLAEQSVDDAQLNAAENATTDGQIRDKRWFQATCAHGICHMSGTSADNPLAPLAMRVSSRRSGTGQATTIGSAYNRPKYGQPGYGYNRPAYNRPKARPSYNRPTYNRPDYGYNRQSQSVSRYGYGGSYGHGYGYGGSYGYGYGRR